MRRLAIWIIVAFLFTSYSLAQQPDPRTRARTPQPGQAGAGIVTSSTALFIDPDTGNIYKYDSGRWSPVGFPACWADPPTGTCIANTYCVDDSNQIIYRCDTSTWTAYSLSAAAVLETTDLDTMAELQALVADATVLDASQLDTFSELQALVADATVLDVAQIDTFSELQTIVADATLVDVAQLDTLAELNTLVGDATLTDSSTQIARDGSNTMTAELGIDELGLEFEAGDSLTDCSTFSSTNGGIFYDDSEGKFKKCQDDVLTDLSESQSVSQAVYNDSGATIYKCSAVYISGFDVPSDLSEVSVADADDPAKMPAIGIVQADIANGAQGTVIVSGALYEADTTTGELWSPGDAVYVDTSGTSTSDDCGETLTNVKPTGTAAIQKMGLVARTNAANGVVQVVGAGRSNDVPNLASANYWLGNGSGVATAVSMSGDATMDNTGAVTVSSSTAADGLNPDEDVNVEVAINSTESALELDPDDDGVVELIQYGNTRTWQHDCFGDNIASGWAVQGTLSNANSSSGRWGVCTMATGASSGNDGIYGLARTATTNQQVVDLSKLRVFKAGFQFQDTTDFRAHIGMMSTVANQDFLQVDEGAYFLCAPADDIDGSGGATADDLTLWALTQAGDTDHTGDVCATKTGDQCLTYTAVNTTATNTGESCDGNEWIDVEIRSNAAGTSITFYVNGVLEATHTTNIPSNQLWSPGVVAIETAAASAKTVHVDYIEVQHAY